MYDVFKYVRQRREDESFRFQNCKIMFTCGINLFARFEILSTFDKNGTLKGEAFMCEMCGDEPQNNMYQSIIQSIVQAERQIIFSHQY